MKEKNKYQSINQRINQSIWYYRVPSEIEKNAALDSLLNKISNSTPKEVRKITLPFRIKAIAGIAAAITVGLISWFVLTHQSIQNKGQEIVSLRLPDHSRVILATGSTVTYNKLFLNKSVKLEGKAYFEVEKGSKFKVTIPGGRVEVMGTRFLVEVKEDEMQVICYQGKVKATFHDAGELLEEGRGISFSDGAKEIKLDVNATYPVFARFSANYQNTSMTLVIKDMEDFFDIKINDQTNQQRLFSGTIDTGSLEGALSILTGSMQLNYDFRDKNTVRIY